MNAYKHLLLFVLIVPLGSATSLFGGNPVDLSRLLKPYEQIVVEPLEDAGRAQETGQDNVPEVVVKKNKITEEEALKALLEAGRGFIGENDSLEINIKSGWRSVSVAADAEWKLYVVEPFAPDNRGRWFPSIVLEVNGDVEESWRLTCEVDLYRMVYMTTQRLARGETPMRPGIEPVICNIYEEVSRPVPVSEDLSNYELVQTVGVGRFLTWADISPKRAVRKGDTVEVILEKGRLMITMQALCMQDGLVEETVRLKNPRTRAEFAGVVTAPGVVKVVN